MKSEKVQAYIEELTTDREKFMFDHPSFKELVTHVQQRMNRMQEQEVYNHELVIAEAVMLGYLAGQKAQLEIMTEK
jgi:hypothetical protein